MTSITSSNTTVHSFAAVYRWTLQRNMGIAVLYTVLLFLIFPLPVLLDGMAGHYQLELVSLWFPLCVVPFTMLFTLIYSGMLFRYMHQKRSVDLFYSLPVKRNTLLMARYCAGLTHILAPLLFHFLFLSAFIAGNPRLGRMDMYGGISMSLFQVVCYLCLSVAASMAFTMLIAVCSGNMMDTMISTVVINLICPMLVFLLMRVSECLLPGIVVQTDIAAPVLTLFCPYGSMLSCYLADRSRSMLSATFSGFLNDMFFYTIWWIFFVVAVIAVTLWLNKRRKAETAESSSAFPIPNGVIRAAATFTAGLGIGYIVALSMEGNLMNFLIGVLLGSAGAYLILEAVYFRGLRHLLKSLPCYAGVLIALGGYFLMMSTGLFGVAYQVPATDHVEKVSVYVSDIGNYNSAKMHTSGYSIYDPSEDSYVHNRPELTSQAGIQNVIALHRQILTGIGMESPGRISGKRYFGSDFFAQITLEYTLKDGSVLTRTYKGDSLFQIAQGQEELCQVLDMEEYTKSSNLIYHIQASDIDTFAYSSSNSEAPETLLATSEQKEELLQALQQDVLQDTVQKQLDYNTYGGQSFGELTLRGYYRYQDKSPNAKKGFGDECYRIPDYFVNTKRVLNALQKSSQ